MIPLSLSNRPLSFHSLLPRLSTGMQIYPKYYCQVVRKGSGNRCRNDFICRQGNRHTLMSKPRGTLEP